MIETDNIRFSKYHLATGINLMDELLGYANPKNKESNDQESIIPKLVSSSSELHLPTISLTRILVELDAVGRREISFADLYPGLWPLEMMQQRIQRSPSPHHDFPVGLTGQELRRKEYQAAGVAHDLDLTVLTICGGDYRMGLVDGFGAGKIPKSHQAYDQYLLAVLKKIRGTVGKEQKN